MTDARILTPATKPTGNKERLMHYRFTIPSWVASLIVVLALFKVRDIVSALWRTRIFYRWPTIDWHVLNPLRGHSGPGDRSYWAFWFGPFKIIVLDK